MPTTNKISVSYHRKVQLEQFEPIQHSVTIESEIEEGEDIDDVYDTLSQHAEELVERALTQRVATERFVDESDESE